MARPAEAAMHRRRIARLLVIVVFAIPLAMVAIVMICAGANADRTR